MLFQAVFPLMENGLFFLRLRSARVERQRAIHLTLCFLKTPVFNKKYIIFSFDS